MSQLFASGGQSIGVSASTSVLPMNTQDWSPLGWTGSISLQSKGLSIDSLLDLIDTVPEELWTEVHDIVQERGINTISKKKKCKKAKWLSEEALQIAVKRREA